MTDKQKFWLSQRHHSRMSNYYYNFGAFKNKKLCIYHSTCVDKQQQLGRILSTEEKGKFLKKLNNIKVLL